MQQAGRKEKIQIDNLNPCAYNSCMCNNCQSNSHAAPQAQATAQKGKSFMKTFLSYLKPYRRQAVLAVLCIEAEAAF